jgi:type I restriction enzyme S subunit
MTDELPSGWSRAPLADVGTWGSGGTPSRSDAKAYGGDIPWLKIGDLPDGPVVSTEERITEHGLAVSAAKLLPPNTLLIAMYGSIGKLGITTEPCATNQAIAFCKPHAGLNLHYLFYLLMGERHRLLEKGQGGTQLNISQTILKAHEVSIAPSAEQKRIVSKIDELFSRIDEGERALQRVSMLVERYRQSVLKAAVTGELTRAWREKNTDTLESGEVLLARILTARREAWEKAELEKMKAKGLTPANDKWKQKYSEPSPPETSDLPELPEGWAWASLPQLGEFGRGKSKHRPRNDPKLYGGNYPFLQTGRVRASGGFIADFDSTYNEAGLAQSKLWPRGTICITIAANIAESGILQFAACFPDSVVGLVPSEFVVGEYVEFFVRTARTSLDRYAPATAQKNINLEILEQVAVPLPPLEEQRAIFSKAQEELSKIADVERTLAQAAIQSSALRQTTLRSAFKGELVPQDFADEPASALLERIDAERGAESAAPKRGRKKKTTA